MLDPILDALRSEGRLESSGVFSLDLEQASAKLAEFQLAEPAQYALRLVAAAVAGGAEEFSLRGRVFSCDGPGFAREELSQLFAALVSSDPDKLALRELASGLNAARLLYPEVELRTRDALLRIEGARLALEEAPFVGGARVTLSGGKKSLWPWRAPEESLVRKRCSLAPLRGLFKPELPAGFTVRLGNPPLPGDAELPGCEWGHGLAVLHEGVARGVTVVHCGVSYRLHWKPDCPACEIVWWTNSLPLDLSRQGLVKGPEMAAFQAYLEEALKSAVALEASRGRMSLYRLAYALEQGVPGLEEQAFFRMADGSPVTLAGLRERYARQGWLGWSSIAWKGSRHGWESTDFVLLEPGLEAPLRCQLPNLVDVSLLATVRSAQRLPAEDYLLRLPLPDRRGEVALRNEPPDGTCRQWLDPQVLMGSLPAGSSSGTWARYAARPSGLDAVWLPADSPYPTPLSLYLALSQAALGPDQEELRAWHLLEGLSALAASFEVPRLPNLLAHESELARVTGLSLPDGWLAALVARIELPSNRGPVSLARLLEARESIWVVPAGVDASWDERWVVSVPPGSWTSLFELARPPANLSPARLPTTPLQRVLAAAPRPLCSLDLLCLLAPEGDYPDVPRLPDGALVLQHATRRAPYGHMLGTGDILRALREVDCQARAYLTGREPDPGEAEQRAEFAAMDPTDPDVLYEEAAWHLYAGRREEARRLLEQSKVIAPGHALLLWARAECETGAKSRQLFERSLRAAPDDPMTLTRYALRLLLEGEPEAARAQVELALSLAPRCSEALAARARLESEPARKLELCDEALQDPHAPETVWETRAEALFELGREAEGRAALERFLLLNPGRVLDQDLPERFEAARGKLGGASGTSVKNG